MAFPKRHHQRGGGSSSSVTSIVLLLAVAMGSFFAGTLLTLHSGIGNCHGSTSGNHPLAKQQQQPDPHLVDEMVQRRLQGKLHCIFHYIHRIHFCAIHKVAIGLFLLLGRSNSHVFSLSYIPSDRNKSNAHSIRNEEIITSL